jgi:hypothetical protein
LALAGLATLTACGCQQQMTRIFHRPAGPPRAVVEQPTFVLVADEAETDTGAPAGDDGVEAAATRPARTGLYTAPSTRFRQLTFLAVLAATPAAPGDTGGGREAAESSLSGGTGSLTGGSGLAGLGAPQPRTLNAVVGQPGLQRGFAAGIGFARPDNIFTPRANPLSGANGRCQELVGSGLFSNQAACQGFFGQ